MIGIAITFLWNLAPIMAAVQLQSPKGAEVFQSKQENISLMPRVISLPPSTNVYHLSWNNPTNDNLSTIRIYHGTNSGQYYEHKDVGIVTNCDFSVGDNDYDYFVATTIDILGQESIDSNQSPPPPPNAVILSWTGTNRSNIYEKSSVQRYSWMLVTNGFSPIILPIKTGNHFFTGETNRILILSTNIN